MFCNGLISEIEYKMKQFLFKITLYSPFRSDPSNYFLNQRLNLVLTQILDSCYTFLKETQSFKDNWHLDPHYLPWGAWHSSEGNTMSQGFPNKFL